MLILTFLSMEWSASKCLSPTFVHEIMKGLYFSLYFVCVCVSLSVSLPVSLFVCLPVKKFPAEWKHIFGAVFAKWLHFAIARILLYLVTLSQWSNSVCYLDISLEVYSKLLSMSQILMNLLRVGQEFYVKT